MGASGYRDDLGVFLPVVLIVLLFLSLVFGIALSPDASSTPGGHLRADTKFPVKSFDLSKEYPDSFVVGLDRVGNKDYYCVLVETLEKYIIQKKIPVTSVLIKMEDTQSPSIIHETRGLTGVQDVYILTIPTDTKFNKM